MKQRCAARLALGCGLALGLSAGVWAEEPIQPVEAVKPANPALVELGTQLYFDRRLSKSGAISCNSCHDLALGGVDNLPSSIGDHWQQGPINAPTVFNSSMFLAQFWDGRAKDLKEQAGGPIANPREMASSHTLAVATLRTIPGYRVAFKKAYGSDTIDIDRVTGAIAAFEQTLVTPDSRFDRYLRGDKQAISAEEKAGYELFKSAGCVACHNGPAVGGRSFQKMGLVAPYVTSNPSQGRYDVTKNEADRMVFKVPSLRNIELTYPYFHDGGAKTLSQAVQTMGRLQLGRNFSADENARIVAFLKTLTGKTPDITLPHLPPSSDATPAPQPFDH